MNKQKNTAKTTAKKKQAIIKTTTANTANLEEETLIYFNQHFTLDCDEIWEKKH